MTHVDSEMFADLAKLISIQLDVAKAKLETAKAWDAFFVVTLPNKPDAVMQVLSETPANTSINFAANPSTFKAFLGTDHAHNWMMKFRLEYDLVPVKDWLTAYIEINETMLNDIKEKGFY